MLTHEELVKLERSLREQAVLSVYLNADGGDSLTRNRWRADLRHSLDDVDSWLRDSSHAEREAFAALRRSVQDRLDAFPGEVGSPGWVGFFTKAGTAYEGPVPVAVPTMAIWSTGPCVAPFIRVIKEARPVIVAIVDSREARLFRYVERAVQEVATFQADLDFELPGAMGRPARQGFHRGTGGLTGTDAAQVVLARVTDQMLDTALSRVSTLAEGGAWIVIGGIPSVATAALSRLAPTVAERAMTERLDVHATLAEVAECARTSASRLRDADDLNRVARTIAAAEAGGTGVTGSVDTMRALDEGRARELFFTRRFLEDHAADIEAAVRSAFDHGTTVVHVSARAAERLDTVGGIAAQLRYAVARETVSEPGSESHAVAP